MHLRRPGRVPGFSYRGRWRYSITACTVDRRARLDDPVWFAVLIVQIRQLAGEEKFAVLAYCAMPDHLHLLVEGLLEDSQLPTFVLRLKQRTGFLYRRMTGRPLWQSGYYDRVLRHEEMSATVCRYILENPVRAGLTSTVGAYPYAGSDVFTVQQVMEAAMATRSQD
jgi:putative transposase